jgi:carbonic anhydrase/acetyltransferase-like protein (isoleucine patch superfamily)
VHDLAALVLLNVVHFEDSGLGLDNAVVGTGCIVAANALVLSNQKLEPYSVYAGVPAKKVKDVTPEQRDEIIKRTARDYCTYASWYK